VRRSVSIAAGRVVSATFDNANGRMVRIRHASGYESYYLHLSAFAPGIKAGASISQGETVGRVGATGLATGPASALRSEEERRVCESATGASQSSAG
jgi:murein DD-endopeptidase MepM/ murein hydrolase activator NlpD